MPCMPSSMPHAVAMQRLSIVRALWKRQEKKRKEKTIPFGVNLTRSLVIYQAAQIAVEDTHSVGASLLDAAQLALKAVKWCHR